MWLEDEFRGARGGVARLIKSTRWAREMGKRTTSLPAVQEMAQFTLKFRGVRICRKLPFSKGINGPMGQFQWSPTSMSMQRYPDVLGVIVGLLLSVVFAYWVSTGYCAEYSCDSFVGHELFVKAAAFIGGALLYLGIVLFNKHFLFPGKK